MTSTPTQRDRLAARFSNVAALACFSINCIANRILFNMPGHDPAWDWIVGVLSSGCVFSGIAMGVYGLINGWRRKNSETATIAAIGLMMNLGIAAVTLWILTLLKEKAS